MWTLTPKESTRARARMVMALNCLKRCRQALADDREEAAWEQLDTAFAHLDKLALVLGMEAPERWTLRGRLKRRRQAVQKIFRKRMDKLFEGIWKEIDEGKTKEDQPSGQEKHATE